MVWKGRTDGLQKCGAKYGGASCPATTGIGITVEFGKGEQYSTLNSWAGCVGWWGKVGSMIVTSDNGDTSDMRGRLLNM
jgi:hypothetical protein